MKWMSSKEWFSKDRSNDDRARSTFSRLIWTLVSMIKSQNRKKNKRLLIRSKEISQFGIIG